MKEELVVAGFGGQGVLTLGMVLAYGGMVEDLEVSWMPSYGPEMRGGTANCVTILSDAPISSPIITSFDTAIILNQPSMGRFEQAVRPGGLLIYEANNIMEAPTRTDITIDAIPAAEEASRMGNSKILNMILLGAFLAHRPIIPVDAVMAGVEKVLPDRYHHLLSINRDAIEKGMALIHAEPVGAQ